MTEQDIIFKPVAGLRVLSTRQVVRDIPALFYAAAEALHRHRVPYREGRWIALYHDEGFDRVDLEVGVVVPDDYGEPVPLAGGGQMTVRELPPVRRMACLTHRGGYNDLCWTYRSFWRWLEERGYRVCGPSREVYLNLAVEVDDDERLTELQFEVAEG